MNEFYDKLDELYGGGDLAAVEEFILNAVSGADESSPMQAGLYNELAGFYRGASRYKESENMFTKSLGIFETAGMASSPEYATVLLNLAGLYRLSGDADKAVGLFKEAMKKLEEAGEHGSYAYVSLLNNIALAWQDKGEPENALEYASRALSIIRAGNGNEHEVASSLNNLAAIQMKLGELEIAGDLISEALDIYDSMAEPDVHHAAALTTKAVLLCRKHDFQYALVCFRRSLELTKRFFGENIEYAICKRNISEVCELLGETPAAISELSDSIRIMEKIRVPEHESVTNARSRLDIMLGVDKYEQ
jgi:tetratricopeptide (TPR) repeat protein